jgi:hypothetical protein
MTDICGTCGLPKFTDMVQMQAEIERLKAELEAETQRRWEGNRIASNEATADFNEVRDMAIKEMARWAREAGASQAREAKLRAFCEFVYRDVSLNDYGSEKLDEVLALPTDDTSLKEAIEAALQDSPEFDLLTRIGQYLSDVDYIGDYVEGIKQAKREAYKDAHDTCAKFGTVQSCLGYLCHQAEEIK